MTLKEFLGLILLVVLVGGFVLLVISIREVEECRRWQEDAKKYSGYYTLQWQEQQCAAHNLIIK